MSSRVETSQNTCDYCSWIERVLRPRELPEVPPFVTICTNVTKSNEAEKEFEEPLKTDPTILVHGTPDSESSISEMERILELLEEAAIEAYKELLKGAESSDCVELAIRKLERERWMSQSWPVVQDAAIMESDSNAGSVGALINVMHPISLAKKVLRDTDHALIVGSGVQNLVNELEKECKSDNFDDEASGSCSRESRIAENSEKDNSQEKKTKFPKVFGALARNRSGHLSCGISTWDSRPEIIKRSSMSATGTVIGCGIFADRTSCCSVSGNPDEAIYAYAPARKIVDRLNREFRPSNPKEPKRTPDAFIEEFERFVESTGESLMGSAILNIQGKSRVVFESRFFPWASCDRGILTSGCAKNELSKRKLDEIEMPLNCECPRN